MGRRRQLSWRALAANARCSLATLLSFTPHPGPFNEQTVKQSINQYSGISAASSRFSEELLSASATDVGCEHGKVSFFPQATWLDYSRRGFQWTRSFQLTCHRSNNVLYPTYRTRKKKSAPPPSLRDAVPLEASLLLQPSHADLQIRLLEPSKSPTWQAKAPAP